MYAEGVRPVERAKRFKARENGRVGLGLLPNFIHFDARVILISFRFGSTCYIRFKTRHPYSNTSSQSTVSLEPSTDNPTQACSAFLQAS